VDSATTSAGVTSPIPPVATRSSSTGGRPCRAGRTGQRARSARVAVRRRYGWSTAGELTGFEDEWLTGGVGAPDGLSRLVTEEIERPRVGPMRDIVATIQPDQDELVRADLDEPVCVQGAPGTGKTAVGLHRAAYLLYTHRQRLRRNGVLVVGPNPEFLRYISAVLPALGEVGVRQATLDDLLEQPVSAVDTPAAAAVKHDVRMAAVLREALTGRIGEPVEALAVPDGSFRWRVSAEVLRRMVAQIREDGPLYGVGRKRLRDGAQCHQLLLQRGRSRRRGRHHHRSVSFGPPRKSTTMNAITQTQKTA
jgi:hypothetical protein